MEQEQEVVKLEGCYVGEIKSEKIYFDVTAKTDGDKNVLVLGKLGKGMNYRLTDESIRWKILRRNKDGK